MLRARLMRDNRDLYTDRLRWAAEMRVLASEAVTLAAGYYRNVNQRARLLEKQVHAAANRVGPVAGERDHRPSAPFRPFVTVPGESLPTASAPAVHRAIVGVDVEGFGDRRRTHLHQIAVRDGLYRALERAFTRGGIAWEHCYHEDRGDGVLILIPSDVPKTLLAQGVPAELAAAAGDHNLVCDERARIRLRLAMHAGEIHHDQHGVTGTAINTAFRLLDAEPLKQALRGSPGTLAVIASRWFFEEVIRHIPACAPASWRRVGVSVKETQEDAWICLPDASSGAVALPPRLTLPAAGLICPDRW
jgi:hypothetical protein